MVSYAEAENSDDDAALTVALAASNASAAYAAVSASAALASTVSTTMGPTVLVVAGAEGRELLADGAAPTVGEAVGEPLARATGEPAAVAGSDPAFVTAVSTVDELRAFILVEGGQVIK